MTDLTEREKQIVAWLRNTMNEDGLADAIEAGEPWKDKTDG